MTTKKRQLKAEVPSRAATGSPPGCIATPKAKAMARHIFSKFDHGRDKCQRLAAMGGKYPDSETKLGGLCEMAFAEMIERALRELNRNQDASSLHALFGAEAEHERAENLGKTVRWLIGQIDRIHLALCPEQNGVWQERVRQAVEASEKAPSDPKLSERGGGAS